MIAAMLASGENAMPVLANNEEAYRIWLHVETLLNTRNELAALMTSITRDFASAQTYLSGGSGTFNELGLLQGNGSRVDVLCAMFNMRLDLAIIVLTDSLVISGRYG
jgi:hypothetical protein